MVQRMLRMSRGEGRGYGRRCPQFGLWDSEGWCASGYVPDCVGYDSSPKMKIKAVCQVRLPSKDVN